MINAYHGTLKLIYDGRVEGTEGGTKAADPKVWPRLGTVEERVEEVQGRGERIYGR